MQLQRSVIYWIKNINCEYFVINFMMILKSTVFNANDFKFWEEIEAGTERYSNRIYFINIKYLIIEDINGKTSDLSDMLDFYRHVDKNDLFLSLSNIHSRLNKDRKGDQPGQNYLTYAKVEILS